MTNSPVCSTVHSGQRAALSWHSRPALARPLPQHLSTDCLTLTSASQIQVHSHVLGGICSLSGLLLLICVRHGAITDGVRVTLQPALHHSAAANSCKAKPKRSLHACAERAELCTGLHEHRDTAVSPAICCEVPHTTLPVRFVAQPVHTLRVHAGSAAGCRPESTGWQ